MTKIIALSGKKQSGKNSAANAILGWQMQKLGLIDKFDLTIKGELFLFDLMNQEVNGIFTLESRTPELQEFLNQQIFPYIRFYSFADQLKKLCIDILGLTYNQCYGTDKDKNSYTKLKWKNFPVKIKSKKLSKEVKPQPKPEYMTAREILQNVGTEFFRRFYPNVWVDATIRQIRIDDSVIAIVTDCRFPNEVKGVQTAEGKVIRLTRNIYKGKDQHDSETALDEDKFDSLGFDHVIDNGDMDLNQQTEALRVVSDKWEIF